MQTISGEASVKRSWIDLRIRWFSQFLFQVFAYFIFFCFLRTDTVHLLQFLLDLPLLLPFACPVSSDLILFSLWKIFRKPGELLLKATLKNDKKVWVPGWISNKWGVLSTLIILKCDQILFCALFSLFKKKLWQNQLMISDFSKF